jgi:PPE-repeat protein
MDFGALPPEINSDRMYSGPGSGPMLAAAAAWDGLVDGLYSTATSFSSVTFDLADDLWQGPAASSMVDAATPYLEWMEVTAAQVEHAAVQVRSAAAAYEAAVAMTVPPAVIAANRTQFVSLAATNFLGQNTPEIAASEAQYSEMWAQNATAMYAYASSSSTASQLNPFTVPAVDLADKAAQAREPAGTLAPTTTPPPIATDPQLYSAVPTALQRLASPTPSSPASPQWTLNPVDNPLSWDMSDLGSSMSTISTLISKIASLDQSGIVGKNLRAQGRPVSVQAWFGGSRAAWISRLSRPTGWRGESVLHAEIGPAASIGKLAVPQAWMAKAPMNPGAVAAWPRTRSSSTPELAAAAGRRA